MSKLVRFTKLKLDFKIYYKYNNHLAKASCSTTNLQ